MVKLSHSAVSKYTSCPKSYYFHYKKKYRPIYQSSALLFGNILDRSVQTYLETKNKEKAVFELIKNWEEQEINGKKTKLMNCLDLVYANSDFDEDLLSIEDLNDLKREYDEDVLDQINSIYKQKEVIGYKLLEKKKKQLLNKANWLCMLRKGLAMLEEAIRMSEEHFLKCYGTQIEVSLDNSSGDKVTGFTDFIVDVKNYNSPVILDLKTSAKFYETDSVLTSPQLSLYLHALGEKYNTRYCGYLVLLKQMDKTKTKICSTCQFDGTGKSHKTCFNVIDKKRCDGQWNETITFKAKSQLIISQIPEHMENITIENIDEVNKAIKAEVFPRNFSACENFGGCPFRQICLSNCSLKDAGLVES